MNRFPIISNLLKPKYSLIAMGAAFPLFSFQYYLMANLPGVKNLACTPGANLTFINISFAVIISFLIGVMISSILILFENKRRGRAVLLSSSSGVASVIGLLTAFCTICSLPVISILGLSLSLELFTTYNLVFKLLSLGMLLFGIYLVNRNLVFDCKICKKL